MTVRLPTKAQFDVLLPQLEALARDWAERECTSFDDAVRRAAGVACGDGSIWDMPAIDSKRTVLLLVEMEALIGAGCKLPVSVIQAGGYGAVEEAIANLFPRIRKRCPDASRPGLATATSPAATSTPAALAMR